MADSGALQRAASTVRCAVAGTPMRRFSASGLSGPRPRPGRVIERVEARRRGITLIWDDGLALDTHVRHAGDWRVFPLDDVGRAALRLGTTPSSRSGRPSVTIATDTWAAVCTLDEPAESYRIRDRRRHPAMGTPGPDLTAADIATNGRLELAAARLLAPPDPTRSIADTLLDARVVRGLGNASRSEALWRAGIHPFAPVTALDTSDVERLLLAAVDVVHAHLGPADDAASTTEAAQLWCVYGRNGQRCHRCATSITARAVGRQYETIYWCPECQQRHDPFAVVRDDTPTMDPHPAAVRFLADLPWNRVDEHQQPGAHG